MRVALFMLMCLMSSQGFSQAQCDEKILMDPRKFDEKEFKIRKQWRRAYEHFKHGKKNAPREIKQAIKHKSKHIRNVRKQALVLAYENGQICQTDHWMTPSRFFEIIARCQSLQSAIETLPSLQATAANHSEAYANYLKRPQNQREISSSSAEKELDEYLKEQAEYQKKGNAQFVMFSIRNFFTEARLIGEHFAHMRKALKSPQLENDLRDDVIERKRQLNPMVKDLRKFLVDKKLLIDEGDEHDLELLYGLEVFSGDSSVVLHLNKLLRDMEAKRDTEAHDLTLLTQALDAMREHFCELSAETYVQEKMDFYAASLDAMMIAMKKYWPRIKYGYEPSLDGLLALSKPRLQFFYVHDRLTHGAKTTTHHDGEDTLSECLFCAEEKIQIPACPNEDHTTCSACLKAHVLAKLESGSEEIPCPYLNCEGILRLDYDRLMSEGIFPYEFFEAFKSRWLTQAGFAKNFARCHMGCYFFHDVPQDKVPGQSSLPCPDCKTSTCLSCGNLAHAGSKECKAPDADAMKKAHELMFQLGFRSCPACGVWSEKVSGCNYVQCPCGQAFSFTDGEPWDLQHARRFGYHEFDVQAPVRINYDL